MRNFIPLIIGTAVAGCAMAPQPAAAPSAQAQSRLAQLLGGKVAGAPQSCLPSWRSQDMVVIDDSTIIFRESGSRVWLQKPQNPCDRLGTSTTALVTRTPTNQLCRGDIAQVIDPTINVATGSCVMGDFVPYTKTAG